jgi:SAM-dependent methyltransferase
MRVLDLGCGHGTITLGLAQTVAPGQVVGIDLDEGRITAARRAAIEQRITNVDFHVGDIRTLPFPDASFDAVFEQAVLMYLREPVRVACEVRRVLKPGGVFAARDTDFAASFTTNLNPLLEQSLDLVRDWYASRGTDLIFGRRLGGVLGEAGFARIEASATCDCFGTPDSRRRWAALWVGSLQQAQLVAFATQSGRADPETLQRMCAAVQRWGEAQDSFNAVVMGEAVGWKE